MPTPEEKPSGPGRNVPTVTCPPSEGWTVKTLLTWTTDYFARAGLQTPRLDAEVLLAHVLQQERLDLYLNYEQPVGEEARKSFRDLVRRRRDAEPVAYLTGSREFFSLPVAVTPSVLIPRPETEHLIEVALRFLQPPSDPFPHSPLHILEIGTGSGNIPLALARHLPGARIVSVDICQDALGVAQENIRSRSDISHRISLVRGDLLTWLREGASGFQLIVSNPPYISAEAWDRLPRDVGGYEPRLALHAGPKGTEILERILDTAIPFLSKEGILLLEIGEDQAERLRKKAEHQEGVQEVRVLPDYAGKPRVLAAGRSPLPG